MQTDADSNMRKETCKNMQTLRFIRKYAKCAPHFVDELEMSYDNNSNNYYNNNNNNNNNNSNNNDNNNNLVLYNDKYILCIERHNDDDN